MYKGFTLIELLVVVAIIALLLLLISPTIQLVSEHRAKVTCLRNLQSQHVAAMQYSNDNNGYLVAIHPTSSPKTSYSDELIKYLEYNDGAFRCPSVFDLSLDLDSANQKILNYGINHYGRADTKNGNSPYHKSMATPYIMIREIANTDVIYLADADYDESPEDIGGVSRGSWDWPIRHSFQEDAWNRHMGRRDPVLPRNGTGRHDRIQYMNAFAIGDELMETVWGGYNSISLAGSGLWRRGYPASNRAWFIKKHIGE